MNIQELKPFEAQLRDTREGLLAQFAFQREGMHRRVDVAEAHFSHPQDSHAQVISAKDIEFAMGELVGAELDAVEAALERMASGAYGACVDCGQAIGMARLQASPQVARCIRCQEAAELEVAAI